MILYAATKNLHKMEEIKNILGTDDFEIRSFPELPEIEETGTTFEENAAVKAVFLSELVEDYVIADDSGLSVNALNGEPGIFSARYSGRHGDDEANIRRLLDKMKNSNDRECAFVCAVALAKNGRLIKTFTGRAEGLLGRETKGDNGFGYDPIFVTEDGRTMAELSPEEKNSLSHRKKALEKLASFLKEEDL